MYMNQICTESYFTEIDLPPSVEMSARPRVEVFLKACQKAHHLNTNFNFLFKRLTFSLHSYTPGYPCKHQGDCRALLRPECEGEIELGSIKIYFSINGLDSMHTEAREVQS